MSTAAQRPETVSQLAELLSAPRGPDVDPEAVVRGLADDSRIVESGDVFFARRGSLADGAAFAEEALARGAAVVVAESELPPRLPSILVPDVDEALRVAADAWYGRPQDALDLVGITGTKGKTTTAYMAAGALRACGLKTAIIGTIEYDVGDGAPEPSGNTTPGILAIRRLLARARDAGCRAAVLEVSSHALDQARTAGLAFKVGVFTNLASDHLDYHRSTEAYAAAKEKLFSGLGPDTTAVVNREDIAWARFAGLCAGKVLTYGGVAEADLRADDVTLSVERSRFRLVVKDGPTVEVETPLVGRHNVLNVLAAIGACMALGFDAETAATGAGSVAGVPGRLERVGSSADLFAFVDYAHTEDALLQVLTFLRGVGAQPLTCVIGCGGDRDRTKRPRMGRVAAEIADQVIFTSDNPRSEDAAAILDEMAAGLDAPVLSARVTRIVDRADAIRHAVETAPPGSTLLVAGKGHERYQIVGTQRRPFDDVLQVREALTARCARDREKGLS